MNHHEGLEQEILLLANKLKIAKSECCRLAKPREIERKRNLARHKQGTEDSKKRVAPEELRVPKPGLVQPKTTALRDKCYSPDELFVYHLKKHRLECHFERITKGVYKFGNKKVSVSIKNDSLICRVSGDFMNIDFFISKYLSAGDKNSHRRLASVIPSAKTEIQVKEKPQRSRTIELIKSRPRTVKGREEESLLTTQTIDTEPGVVHHSIEASACCNISKLIHDTVSSLKTKLKDTAYAPLYRARSSTCLR